MAQQNSEAVSISFPEPGLVWLATGDKVFLLEDGVVRDVIEVPKQGPCHFMRNDEPANDDVAVWFFDPCETLCAQGDMYISAVIGDEYPTVRESFRDIIRVFKLRVMRFSGHNSLPVLNIKSIFAWFGWRGKQ